MPDPRYTLNVDSSWTPAVTEVRVDKRPMRECRWVEDAGYIDGVRNHERWGCSHCEGAGRVPIAFPVSVVLVQEWECEDCLGLGCYDEEGKSLTCQLCDGNAIVAVQVAHATATHLQELQAMGQPEPHGYFIHLTDITPIEPVVCEQAADWSVTG